MKIIKLVCFTFMVLFFNLSSYSYDGTLSLSERVSIPHRIFVGIPVLVKEGKVNHYSVKVIHNIKGETLDDTVMYYGNVIVDTLPCCQINTAYIFFADYLKTGVLHSLDCKGCFMEIKSGEVNFDGNIMPLQEAIDKIRLLMQESEDKSHFTLERGRSS